MVSAVGSAVAEMRSGLYLSGTPEDGIINVICIEMSRFYGDSFGGTFPSEKTLVLNMTHPLSARLSKIWDADKDDARLLIEQIYDLALMGQEALSPERMQKFLARSQKLLGMIGK